MVHGPGIRSKGNRAVSAGNVAPGAIGDKTPRMRIDIRDRLPRATAPILVAHEPAFQPRPNSSENEVGCLLVEGIGPAVSSVSTSEVTRDRWRRRELSRTPFGAKFVFPRSRRLHYVSTN